MVTVIVNGFKEPNTIGKCIKSLADPKYSGISGDYEVIQISPDKETLDAGLKAAKEIDLGKKFSQIVDPHKGKPFALKMAFKQAKGDILILTDGDTYSGKNAVKELLTTINSNEKIGGVSGRPISVDSRSNFWGYLSHVLTDSADDRRRKLSQKVANYYISGKSFFPMSGYLFATKNVLDVPQGVLADDAYMSYLLRNKGYEIAYNPNAEVFVKFPNNLEDYLKQKSRSLGGYIQLQRMDIFGKEKQSRSFWIELGYAFFVLKYAKSFKELIFSILIFPLRLLTWFRIFYERVLLNKGMGSTGWERIESTK